MKVLPKEYHALNKSALFREFKSEYNYPRMYATSYRRVLHGDSTYLGKGRSPYISDLFKFFSKKLNKPFINVAYDLLDSEFFGRKNNLLDVLVAECGTTIEEIKNCLKQDATVLEYIRLCDLNDDNIKIYNSVKKKWEAKKHDIN